MKRLCIVIAIFSAYLRAGPLQSHAFQSGPFPSALSGLTGLTGLNLEDNRISKCSPDLSALLNLKELPHLNLKNNGISDFSPLVANPGLGDGDLVDVRGNPLSVESLNTHVPALQSRGVDVQFDNRTPVSECLPIGPLSLSKGRRIVEGAALSLLEGFDLKSMGHLSADYMHVAIEAIKLAMADRDAYYADPDFVDVPLSELLSDAYTEIRRPLIDMEKASLEACPGDPYRMVPFRGTGVFEADVAKRRRAWSRTAGETLLRRRRARMYTVAKPLWAVGRGFLTGTA